MKIIINNYRWYLFDSVLYENFNKTGANIHVSKLTVQERQFVNQILIK